jgi:hypothetical protein
MNYTSFYIYFFTLKNNFLDYFRTQEGGLYYSKTQGLFLKILDWSVRISKLLWLVGLFI